MFLNSVSRSFTALFASLLFTTYAHALQPGQEELGGGKSLVTSAPAGAAQYVRAEHLSTAGEHDQFLFRALCEARKSVTISSYSISSALFRKDIHEAIDAAVNRPMYPLKVYIYYSQDLPNFSREDQRCLESLRRNCTVFAQISNHSKVVIQDNTKVAIGSYNWLSESDERSLNRSLIMSGLSMRALVEDVWQGIRFYQSIEHGNIEGQKHYLYDRDVFSTGAYQFAPGEFYYTLRSPEAHAQFLEDEVFGKAQSDIRMCSPFIRLDRLRSIFTDERMRALEERGVRTHLFTLPQPCTRGRPGEQDQIFEYLSSLTGRYPHFSYGLHDDLHAKTLIADDAICEGSHNWLSAIDDIGNDRQNFEMSVAVRGQIATPFVKGFHDSLLGQCVVPFGFFDEQPQIQFVADIGKKEVATVPASSQSYGGASSVSSFPSPSGTPRSSASPDSDGSLAFLSTPPVPVRTDRESHRSPSRAEFRRASRRGMSPYARVGSTLPIETFSGGRFNKSGFCARFEGEYIRNDAGQIIYFSTQHEAESVAMEVFGRGFYETSSFDYSSDSSSDYWSDGSGYGNIELSSSEDWE